MLIGSWPIEDLRNAASRKHGIIIADRKLMIGRCSGEQRQVCSINDILNVIEPVGDDDPPAPSIVHVTLVEYAIELDECFRDPLYDIVIAGANLPFGPPINGWRTLPTGVRARHTCVGLWDVTSLGTKELYTLLLQQVIA